VKAAEAWQCSLTRSQLVKTFFVCFDLYSAV